MSSSSRGGNRLFLLLALAIGLAVGLGAAFLLAGGGDDEPEVAATTGDLTRDGDPDAGADLPDADPLGDPAEATDPEAALRGFLAAEAAGEWEVSYDYLTDDLREAVYTTPAAWVRAHADIPRVTAYELEDVVLDEENGLATIRTLTGFDPVIDPVLGLVAARGRTEWTLEVDADADLWRVNTNGTTNQPLYPSSDGAEGSARAWVDARVACEDSTDLEAGLVGSRTLASMLCDEDQPDEVAVGPISSLADSAESATLLSQFGPEVFGWARTAVVEATTPFTVVLGPVGEEWRVVAVLNQS